MFPDEDEWAGVSWDEYGAALDLRFFQQHDAGGEGSNPVGVDFAAHVSKRMMCRMGGGSGPRGADHLPLKPDNATCAAAMEVDGGGAMDMAQVEQPTKLVTEQVDLLLRAQVRAVLHSRCGSTSCHLAKLSGKPAMSLAVERQQPCCPAPRQLGLCTVQLPRNRNCRPARGAISLYHHCTALPCWPIQHRSLSNPHASALCRVPQVLHLPGFEGRTDGRSQRTIIGHVAPRHLVIVNGSAEVIMPCEIVHDGAQNRWRAGSSPVAWQSALALGPQPADRHRTCKA